MELLRTAGDYDYVHKVQSTKAPSQPTVNFKIFEPTTRSTDGRNRGHREPEIILYSVPFSHDVRES